MIVKIKIIWKAIKICHAGKYVPLNVKHSENFSRWQPQTDVLWNDYKRSVAIIPEWIWKILKVLKIV